MLSFFALKVKTVKWFPNVFLSAAAALRSAEPHFHLDLDRSEPWSSPSPRPSPFLSEAPGARSHTATPERRGSPLPDFGQPRRASLEGDVGGLRHRAKAERQSDEAGGSPRRGLHQYLSRFDDAMKLRSQLANEKPAQDGGSDVEEFDPFRVFRLVGSVLLAVFVRVFVCKYLVGQPAVDRKLQIQLMFLSNHRILIRWRIRAILIKR